MNGYLRDTAAALASLCALGTAGGHPGMPAPSQPRPMEVVCNAGLATLQMHADRSSSTEQVFTLRAWPASKAKTFPVAVVDWDGSLLLRTGDGEMKGGKAVAQSMAEVAITAKRAKGSGPISFTLTLFDDSKCQFQVPSIKAGGL